MRRALGSQLHELLSLRSTQSQGLFNVYILAAGEAPLDQVVVLRRWGCNHHRLNSRIGENSLQVICSPDIPLLPDLGKYFLSLIADALQYAKVIEIAHQVFPPVSGTYQPYSDIVHLISPIGFSRSCISSSRKSLKSL